MATATAFLVHFFRYSDATRELYISFSLAFTAEAQGEYERVRHVLLTGTPRTSH